MRFTSLVNKVAKQGRFSRRSDREARKRELFALICRLVRVGRIIRTNNFLTLAPQDTCLTSKHLETVIGDLPHPNL